MKKKPHPKKTKLIAVKSASKRRTFLKMIFVYLLVVGVMWAMAGLQIGRHMILAATTPCANSISCINDLSGRYDPTASTGVFMGTLITPPPSLAKDTNTPTVLGETTAAKHIYVDLSAQHLYAFEGNKLVYDFLVSTGKWHKTPTGDFKIWIKLRYTRMTGGDKSIGTYYDLPNVPYTMFIYNSDYAKSEGYSLHGAYWHNNFGHPMSHGCVNMKEEDVAQIYAWANPSTEGSITYASNDNPGTPVTIYGVTPNE